MSYQYAPLVSSDLQPKKRNKFTLILVNFFSYLAMVDLVSINVAYTYSETKMIKNKKHICKFKNIEFESMSDQNHHWDSNS